VRRELKHLKISVDKQIPFATASSLELFNVVRNEKVENVKLTSTLVEKDKLLQEKDTEVQEMVEEIQRKDKDIEAKSNLLQEKDNLIHELQKSIDDFKGPHRKVGYKYEYTAITC